MGLLDELTNQVLGGGNPSGNTPSGAGIAEAVLGMLQGHGGLGGLAQIFKQKGMGDLMNQWVSNGPNTPMSADQAHQVFGPSQIGEIARKLGLNPQMAAAAIAAVLPMIIDKLTPHGTIPPHDQHQASGGSLLEQGLDMLRGSGLLD